MSAGTDIRLAINMELQCSPECREHADSLYMQLGRGPYSGEMAVLPIPLEISQWRDEHRTARRRADRAAGRGYYTKALHRPAYADDIHQINISATHRQGRPMSAGYTERQEFSPLPLYLCPRHATRISGVFARPSKCLGYLVMIRAGELALVSQILGHDAYLDDEIMYLLFEFALKRESDADPEGVVVYNTWDSGTEGLRFFKQRLGFEPIPVEWLP